MEAELELEEPMEMGDDASSLEDKKYRGVAMTLVEHHKPMATLVDGERGTEVRGDVPESRKRAAIEDAALKREAKRARSPCPLEASLALWPPTPSVAEHVGRSGGRDCSPMSLGSTCMCDPQWRGASPVALVVSP